MAYVQLVMLLAVLEFLLFGYAVGSARTRYKVAAPAMTGHPVFECYVRVQMNTLEQLIVFLPSILLFARYINAWAAAALGALFILGRALYFRGYVQAPESRHAGFVLSAIPTVTLLIGALIGVIRAILAGG
ncbi:MAG TPA: MAPEG family protein [Steroidobacteraceae bacterium]|nr:MAPEG family protein [Steroidobacteraceae bacterium]